MESWRAVTLRELLKVEHGFAFKGKYFSESGHYILLTPGNFHEKGGFKLRPGKDRFYMGRFPPRYILSKGSMIVAMTEQAEGLLGSPALVPEPDRYLHNQRLGRVQAAPELADTHFLYHLFNTNVVRQQIRNSSSGAKVRHTSPERIYRVKVTVPDIGTQRKIAAILTAYDDLIETNKRRIALLEKMAEEIYREWFVRMRFPDYQNSKFTKGIPKGWEMIKIEHAFEFTGGGTPSKSVAAFWNEGSVNWYTPSDITGSAGIYLDESGDKCADEGVARSSANMFPAYSVMMTSRATIGAIGINTTPACTNQGFITCIPNERYPLPYLYQWLKLAKPYFVQLCGGATFPELTKGTFKKLEILTPPETLLEEFSQVTTPIFKAIETALNENKVLTKTRDLLLPRLISGKLSVEDLDIQFPPSMHEQATDPSISQADRP